ncbi:MAG: transposase [Thermoplasmataceae archaeon]
MSITAALRNDRLCKALTGLSIQEFRDLVEPFSWYYEEYWAAQRKNPQRGYGAGRKGCLDTYEEKLFAGLMYLKAYATYDVFGFHIGCDRSQACRWVAHIFPVLELTLQRKLLLPERKITSIEEFQEKFPEVTEVMVDGTERRRQRPKKKKSQQKTYSGKKKTHTRKNIVVTDKNRRILILTKTKSGRRHDKRLADKEAVFENIPKDIPVFTDTAFVGEEKLHPNLLRPKKKPKGRNLTYDERETNKIISSYRILVEHAIGGIKRYQAVTQVYRNRKKYFDDTLILLSAGLWNYHLAS